MKNPFRIKPSDITGMVSNIKVEPLPTTATEIAINRQHQELQEARWKEKYYGERNLKPKEQKIKCTKCKETLCEFYSTTDISIGMDDMDDFSSYRYPEIFCKRCYQLKKLKE